MRNQRFHGRYEETGRKCEAEGCREAGEIRAAQSPVFGWQTESRAFRADAGVDGMPRWADFNDPLDAIGSRAADIKARAAWGQRNDASQARFTPREREAQGVMG